MSAFRATARRPRERGCARRETGAPPGVGHQAVGKLPGEHPRRCVDA
ncbi:hypothetical protein [Planomonospora alba]